MRIAWNSIDFVHSTFDSIGNDGITTLFLTFCHTDRRISLSPSVLFMCGCFHFVALLLWIIIGSCSGHLKKGIYQAVRSVRKIRLTKMLKHTHWRMCSEMHNQQYFFSTRLSIISNAAQRKRRERVKGTRHEGKMDKWKNAIKKQSISSFIGMHGYEEEKNTKQNNKFCVY